METLSAGTRQLPNPARRSLCTAATLTLLGACAAPAVTPVRRGESVGLVFFRAPADRATKIDNLSLGPAAQAGAGTGAMAGAISGLSCGPFAVLCVPLGMLVGGVAGWGGGAVVGLTATLPEEKATQLRERLARLLQSHDVLAELRDNVTNRAGKVWTLGAEKPAHVLTVELRNIELSSTRSQEIGLNVQVFASMQRMEGQPPRLSQKAFQFTPAPNSLAVWLDESSDVLDTLLSGCSQQLAAQIVAEFARD